MPKERRRNNINDKDNSFNPGVLIGLCAPSDGFCEALQGSPETNDFIIYDASAYPHEVKYK
jgi:hypothetical protein